MAIPKHEADMKLKIPVNALHIVIYQKGQHAQNVPFPAIKLSNRKN